MTAIKNDVSTEKSLMYNLAQQFVSNRKSRHQMREKPNWMPRVISTKKCNPLVLELNWRQETASLRENRWARKWPK